MLLLLAVALLASIRCFAVIIEQVNYMMNENDDAKRGGIMILITDLKS
jgi:hypothetical protein